MYSAISFNVFKIESILRNILGDCFLAEIVRTVAAKPVNKHILAMFYVRK